ncbi:MAG: hypothetical protein QM811_15415 [Pirellulales bacterium]
MSRRFSFPTVLLSASLWCGVLAAADSGPTENEPAPELKVATVVGDHIALETNGKELDWAKQRDKSPTIVFFVRTDRFTRPLARTLKQVDAELAKIPDAAAVAVWLTEDADKTKNHLPLVQQSLDLKRTIYAYFAKDRAGPDNWGVNPDVDLTAVVVRDGKVVKRFGIVGPNEKTAAEILAAFPIEKKTP